MVEQARCGQEGECLTGRNLHVEKIPVRRGTDLRERNREEPEIESGRERERERE